MSGPAVPRWDAQLLMTDAQSEALKMNKDTIAVFESSQPRQPLAARQGKSLPCGVRPRNDDDDDDNNDAEIPDPKFKLSEHVATGYTIANFGTANAVHCSNCYSKNTGTVLGCYSFSEPGGITLKHGACNCCVEVNKGHQCEHHRVSGYRATSAAVHTPPSQEDKALRRDFYDRAGIPVPNSLLPPSIGAPAGMVMMPDGTHVPEGRQMQWMQENKRQFGHRRIISENSAAEFAEFQRLRRQGGGGSGNAGGSASGAAAGSAA